MAPALVWDGPPIVESIGFARWVSVEDADPTFERKLWKDVS